MVSPKKPDDHKIHDDPGAEDRFMRGIGKALSTPPKPFTPKKAKEKEIKSKGKIK